MLKRDVAIKVPHRHLVNNPEQVELYIRGRRLASLDHPHIVPVFEAERTADGLCYVVSKFIEGTDLGAATSKAPFRIGTPRKSSRSSPRPCTTRISARSCIGTSSLPTSSWMAPPSPT